MVISYTVTVVQYMVLGQRVFSGHLGIVVSVANLAPAAEISARQDDGAVSPHDVALVRADDVLLRECTHGSRERLHFTCGPSI